jgi:hypothetical protein
MAIWQIFCVARFSRTKSRMLVACALKIGQIARRRYASHLGDDAPGAIKSLVQLRFRVIVNRERARGAGRKSNNR